MCNNSHLFGIEMLLQKENIETPLQKEFTTHCVWFPRKLLFSGFGYPKVTVHKCAETIQGRKLFEEIQY